MDQKGQTTIEYIMLLGGVLLMVVIAFVILRSPIGQGKQDINRSMINYNNATNTSGYV
jgi:hypothetical protein